MSLILDARTDAHAPLREPRAFGEFRPDYHKGTAKASGIQDSPGRRPHFQDQDIGDVIRRPGIARSPTCRGPEDGADCEGRRPGVGRLIQQSPCRDISLGYSPAAEGINRCKLLRSRVADKAVGSWLRSRAALSSLGWRWARLPRSRPAMSSKTPRLPAEQAAQPQIPERATAQARASI